MKVSHRLYLTVLPAVLGVLTVAGLSYWGQYAHAIPEILLIIAVIAACGSLTLSWVNARYVAQRIERLAGSERAEPRPSVRGMLNAILARRTTGDPDELDRIEDVVDSLSNAVADAEAAKTERERNADRRVAEYAALIASVASVSTARLEEVRLPLHILLENHFGDLNENQEEILGAARNAAEAVDADLVALRQIAELDLGRRELRHDRVLPGDLLRALIPTLQASAEQANATLRVDIEPGAAAIHGDPPLLHDSLATLLGDAIKSADAGAALSLTLARQGGVAILRLDGTISHEQSARSVLAAHVVAMSGGQLTRDDNGLTITFNAAVK